MFVRGSSDVWIGHFSKLEARQISLQTITTDKDAYAFVCLYVKATVSFVKTDWSAMFSVTFNLVTPVGLP